MEVETRMARRDAPDVIASAAAGDEFAFLRVGAFQFSSVSLTALSADAIDDDPSHRFGGGGEEVSLPIPMSVT